MSKLLAEKTCNHCGETKPITEFTFHRYNLSDLSEWCRDCRKSFAKLYEESPEGILEIKAQHERSKLRGGGKQAKKGQRRTGDIMDRPGVRKQQNRVGISNSDKK